MSTHTIRIAMNGVTGRMGTNQHLIRSILAIRAEGGIPVGTADRILPEPLLVGRNADKLRALAAAHGDLPWSTDLDAVLADPGIAIYFDALATQQRYDNVLKAVAAGKHVYCEKPCATTSAEALDLHAAATKAGVKHGVVQDKLWLPGLLKLRQLLDTGYFGDLVAVKGDFGYWVFTGEDQPAQRPSWNYRAEDGGGIIVDMLCHWRYVIDNLFGRVTSVSCLGATHIARRLDEQARPYACTADDAAYATFETDRGVICQFNSSWCTRVRRDDLLTIQVDGTRGSAVAVLRDCWVQPAATTPRPVWNPDIPSAIDYRGGWTPMPDNRPYDNAFKAQWILFLRHVLLGEPFPWDLREGAKGVQLAELGIESWKRRAWVDVPEI
jgi:predicted dehydrogenase